jgi:hypothetical protein
MPRVIMTFEEFQATQKIETKAEYEARTRTDTGDDNAVRVLSYGHGNHLYILDYGDGEGQGYGLVLEREYYDGFYLERLERLLYEWGVSTGCCDVDEGVKV